MIAVIAHRGASVDHAENSLTAIAKARECGADWIEVDVRMTKDGEVVVHHDKDLFRSAGMSRNICEGDLEELRGIKLAFLDHPKFHMPTLQEAIEAASPIPLCVEIKTDGEPRTDTLTDRTVDMVRSDERVRIISFDDRVIHRARKQLPSKRVGIIRNKDLSADAWRDGIDADVDLVVLSRKITSHESVATLRDHGRSVWAYALDDAASVGQHLAWGVEGIISNRPDIAVAAVRSWPASAKPEH